MKSRRAAVVFGLFRENATNGFCYLKAKRSIEKQTKKSGALQRIIIGFKGENEKLEMVKTHLS